ncbi:MAG TPA: BON domain-containing protein [Candidatus Limnocylindrales bacterium]|nr:BON domain-containing protein [Candidatus Limnocylindrales bacterium]
MFFKRSRKGIPARLRQPIDDAARSVSGVTGQSRPRSRWLGAAVAAAAASGLTALATYFADPDRGRGRRAVTRDRLAGMARRAGREAERTRRRVVAGAWGMTQRVGHMGGGSEPVDDVALAHRVESELFRDQSIPKGRININAESGVVVLRGSVDDEAMVRDIEARTRRIGGVREVSNLLRVTDAEGAEHESFAGASSGS